MGQISNETMERIKNLNCTRFHLGCGTIFLKDWINIGYWQNFEDDQVYLIPLEDETNTILLNHDLVNGIPAEDNTLDAVYHSHLLEHLSYHEGLEFLQRIYNALKPGGIHRIVLPDLEAFTKAYLTSDSLLLDKYKTEVLHAEEEIYQTKASIFMGMLHNHGHKCGYDFETLKWALNRIGFTKIERKLFQESDFPDIKTMEIYSPLRALESLCVECYK